MSEQPLSILHVLTTRAPRYGGPPRMAELCTALGRLGHHVEMISTTVDGPDDLDVATAVPVREDAFLASAFPVLPPREYTFSPSLARWLWRNVGRFDVVHAHSVYRFTTFAAARICSARSVPYLWHPHGALTAHHQSRHRPRKAAYEWLIERPNARGAANAIWESKREQIEAVAAGWPAGEVVWSGVWVPEAPAETRRRGEVVFLGRLAEKKGVDLLVEAFAHVVAAWPDARLRLVGPDEGGRADLLRVRARELGIADAVAFDGYLEGRAKEDVLRHAAVHVLPSADESFGAAAIEAMAYATPVVLTRAFPFWEEASLEDACVVVARESRAIAAGILSLLSDRPRARVVGENARAFVASRFAWERIAADLVRLYRGAIGTQATGRDVAQDARGSSQAAVVRGVGPR